MSNDKVIHMCNNLEKYSGTHMSVYVHTTNKYKRRASLKTRSLSCPSMCDDDDDVFLSFPACVCTYMSVPHRGEEEREGKDSFCGCPTLCVSGPKAAAAAATAAAEGAIRAKGGHYTAGRRRRRAKIAVRGRDFKQAVSDGSAKEGEREKKEMFLLVLIKV